MNSQQEVIYGLMGDLEEVLDKGLSFGYYSVEKKDTVTNLLDKLYAALPDEIKEARALLRRKDELQYEAQQKAEKIIADAQADVMITEILEAGYYVKKDSRLAAPLIHSPFTRGELGVLMPKGKEDLLDFVNSFILNAKTSGRIDELANKYIYGNE